MTQVKNWCFTINNYDQNIQDAITRIQCRYIQYGCEVASTGTRHLQGFICFERKLRLGGVRRLLPTAHLEPMRGTIEQNNEYCSKVGKDYVRGEMPESNDNFNKRQRADWQKIKDLASIGNFEEIDPEIYIKYRTNLRRLPNDFGFRPQRLPHGNPVGIWIHGATGTGKSLLVHDTYPKAFITCVDDKTGFPFDGYNFEDVVVLEDFDPYQIKWSGLLKRLVDFYPFHIAVKGSSMLIRPKKVIVTSNYTISDIWAQDPITIECLSRRFIQLHKTKDNTFEI